MNKNLKKTIVFILLLAIVFGEKVNKQKTHFSKKHSQQQAFQKFKKSFGKSYDSHEHESYRLSVFLQNMQEVDRLNSEQSSAQFGVTQFSDLSDEEFMQLYSGVKPSAMSKSFGSYIESTSSTESEQQPYPSVFDLRTNTSGFFQEAKNQGGCGAVLAFASTATIEYLYSKQSLNINLSEQQLVDCGTTYDGCIGAMFTDYYDYAVSTGIALRENYPWTGVYGTCKASTSGTLYKITGYKKIDNTPQKIKYALYKDGALIACVDVLNWKQYTGGILPRNKQGTECLAGVAVVGYTQQYWTVRNSWGKYWGESGYIRLGCDTSGFGGILRDDVYQPY